MNFGIYRRTKISINSNFIQRRISFPFFLYLRQSNKQYFRRGFRVVGKRWELSAESEILGNPICSDISNFVAFWRFWFFLDFDPWEHFGFFVFASGEKREMEIDKAIGESDDKRLKTKYNNAIFVIKRALALYSWALFLFSYCFGLSYFDLQIHFLQIWPKNLHYMPLFRYLDAILTLRYHW